ncbi:YbaK/EbsC family protein [Weissella fangxianensis]|uniref:YbaK/EbsC family protein n=1 Tax=Weissella fangxianensis TaxID=2953879 RepID=UPI0021584BDD|nr:YbaK/EbsC family protein [Weissella fangxianensis]
MAFEKVNQYFKQVGLGNRVKQFDESSATVLEAAHALNCEPAHIAKTMSFLVDDEPVLIVMAGDAKVDNRQFKQEFHKRPKMIHSDEVEHYIGHAPGGVCPFVTKDGVITFLDESLKRFDVVYPAAGDDHSAVELSVPELDEYTQAERWINVCKGWQDEVAED